MSMSVKSAKSFFFRMLCGVFLGISIIAPGISGSVMAVMMGIYDDLIDIISNPFKNLKKNILYILPMCIGAGLAIIMFLQLLDLLFENFSGPGYYLFISLIAGSIPTILKETGGGKLKKRYVIGAACAFLFALSFGILSKYGMAITVDTATAAGATLPLYFSFCGLAAGIMSMVPGMSVSMVLMMLGAYEPLLKAAARFDIITMMPAGICFLVGMVLFSNLAKVIFKKYRSFGYFMVFGFIAGSIISIFPGLPSGLTDWVLSAAAILTGLGVSYGLLVLGKKINPAKGPDKGLLHNGKAGTE